MVWRLTLRLGIPAATLVCLVLAAVLLSIRSRPPSVAPTVSAKASALLSVQAWVSPDPMYYGASGVRCRVCPFRSLYARTLPGASCTALVVYSTGHRLASFSGSPTTAGSSGIVTWPWHDEPSVSGGGGTAIVTCSWHGQTKTGTASFTVTS
jgi:hypothetical protein